MLDKDITTDSITEFVAAEQLPLVVEFSDEVCHLFSSVCLCVCIVHGIHNVL